MDLEQLKQQLCFDRITVALALRDFGESWSHRAKNAIRKSITVLGEKSQVWVSGHDRCTYLQIFTTCNGIRSHRSFLGLGSQDYPSASGEDNFLTVPELKFCLSDPKTTPRYFAESKFYRDLFNYAYLAHRAFCSTIKPRIQNQVGWRNISPKIFPNQSLFLQACEVCLDLEIAPGDDPTLEEDVRKWFRRFSVSDLVIEDAVDDPTAAKGYVLVPASDANYRRGARIIYFQISEHILGKAYIKDHLGKRNTFRIEWTFKKGAIRSGVGGRVAFSSPEQLQEILLGVLQQADGIVERMFGCTHPWPLNRPQTQRLLEKRLPKVRVPGVTRIDDVGARELATFVAYRPDNFDRKDLADAAARKVAGWAKAGVIFYSIGNGRFCLDPRYLETP